MYDSKTIAWLVPTARGSSADKAVHLPSNNSISVPITTSSDLASRLPTLLTSKPSHAIQLSFDQTPKRPGRFVLGTDLSCDVILPTLPGLSKRHCALSFDAEGRLTLEDFSTRGTQVWYDWESNGDQTDYTWILSSGYTHGFPNSVQRITIDIQGIRFQIVANDHSSDMDTYKASVDAFCERPSWMDSLAASWNPITPTPPLFSSVPSFQHIFIKELEEESLGGMYLWNLAKPWEPMVRAAA